MDENLKGLIICAAFLAICAALFIVAHRMRKRIDEDGIEASGVISRVDQYSTRNSGVKIRVYARYRTEDGEEMEGLLLDAPSSLQPGQRVRLKYHPTLPMNAKVLGMEWERESSEFRVL